MKNGYRDEVTIIQDEALSKDAKRALLGILKYGGNVKSYPSSNDLEFLNEQYSKPTYNIEVSTELP